MFYFLQISQTFQWVVGVTLTLGGLALTVGLWILSNFLRRLESDLKEIKQLHAGHETKDDERFEKQTDRLRTFEKEFSAEVRSALTASHDNYIKLKDWCVERFSK